MKNSTTKSINDVFQNSSLAKIVQRANALNTLNLQVQQRLPDQFRGLYRILNLVDNTLIFEVQNATIRQGLQLQSAMLLTLIQMDFPEVQTLQFKLNPNFKHF